MRAVCAEKEGEQVRTWKALAERLAEAAGRLTGENEAGQRGFDAE